MLHILNILQMLNIHIRIDNRPFSKMAAENSNASNLAKIKNVYQHHKEHQTIVWLGNTYVCKFINFQPTFSQLILHLKCWNFAGLLKQRCSF